MKEKNSPNGINSIIIPLIVGLMVWGVLFFRYGFYYDLNDDALINDILSGVYTGSGNLHNAQMLAPVSFVLCILYKVAPFVPWMGMLEVFLMFTCFMLIGQRTHEILEQKMTNAGKRRVILIIFYAGLISISLGLFLWEIVMIQYTVVCGLLASTAAYLFYLDTEDIFEVRNHSVSIVFVILAFNIRSEMLLLLLPFLGTVFLIRWNKEGFFHKTNKKFLKFVGIILAGMIVSFLIDKVAYSSKEWDEFRDFFDARTEVYDFTGIPAYEENQAFYNSESVNVFDYEALTTYNFELSERINTQLLEDIAGYVNENVSFGQKIKKFARASFDSALLLFKFETPAKQREKNITDSGFIEDAKSHGSISSVVLVLYISCVLLGIVVRDKAIFYKLALLFVMRTIPWTYVLYRGRINVRIAHPLYLMEMLILFAFFIVSYFNASQKLKKRGKNRAYILLVASYVIVMGISCAFILNQLKNADEKVAIRESNNELCTAMYTYTSKNFRNYYFIDVYSSVDFTEKIWKSEKYQKGNTQLAGGWIANSPLDTEKKSHYTDKKNWYFISKDNQNVSMTMVDVIETKDGSQQLYVYKY